MPKNVTKYIMEARKIVDGMPPTFNRGERIATLINAVVNVLVNEYDGEPAAVKATVESIVEHQTLRASMSLFAASERSSARIKAGAKS